MGGSGARDETAEGLIPPVVIYGLGFTGRRLARRLLTHRGPAGPEEVFAVARRPKRFRDLASAGLRLLTFGANPPRNALIFHSIPPLAEPENRQIRHEIEQSAPLRIVYISSTGVYGGAAEVNAETVATPGDERGLRRLAEERWVAAGPWSSLILRAAAIYGSGRGVHVAIREGRMPRGSGSGIVSRIHVEDLAAISEAALFASLEGAWPVADEHACPSGDIAAFLGVRATPPAKLEISVSGRKVDGTAVLAALGIRLLYPEWKSGIPASLAEEQASTRA